MDEKQSKRRAGIITGIFQLLLLLVLYFIVVWQEPIPPNPEYGIELSFLQASAASSSSSSQASPPKSSSSESEPVETTSEPVESQPTAVNETETSATDAVDPVYENSLPEATEPEPTETAPEATNDVKQEQNVEEEKVMEQENVEEETTEVTDKTTETEAGEGQAEQGQEGENQEIDERALYGNQGDGPSEGSSAGASLSLAGWMWDSQPNPKDESDETGKIIYEITVNNEGYINGIKLLESSVSPALERQYRLSIEQLSFSKTAQYQPAPLSKGTITFIIKTK